MTTQRAANLLFRAMVVLPIALSAQQQSAPPPDTTFIKALQDVRATLKPGSCGLDGAGGRAIAEAARAAQFTVIGEAHGVNAVPRFAGALFCDLAHAGYRHLAIEVSPTWGPELSRNAASPQGLVAVNHMGNSFFPGPPFYMLREEAEFLVQASKAVGGRVDAIWGIDYDVTPEALIVKRLENIVPLQEKAAVLRLRAVAESMYVAALGMSNPGKVFAFAGSRALLDSTRARIRPTPGSEADRLLRIMEGTLDINALWISGRGYDSNLQRSENLKRNFANHYWAAAKNERLPKVMIKLGASHSYRGRSLVNTFDVGSFVPELAAMNGTSSVSILLIAGAGAQQAQFNPQTFSYSPRANDYATANWTKPFFELADSTEWTVFDLRRLRAAATQAKLGTLPFSTQQAIFGFDFLVILTGSGPSIPLELRKPAWVSPKS